MDKRELDRAAGRKMRILLLNYEFPPIGAGAANASAQIARHLVRRGAEVVVLTSHLKGLPRIEERDGYKIIRVPVFRRKLDRCSVPEMGAYIACSALPTLRLAARFHPDLMHVYFGMPTGPLGLLVNKLQGIPYLLSLRGGDVPGFLGDELATVHRITMPLTRRVWHNAARIVVNSEGLRDLAARTVPNRDIDVVPNGVDLERFYPLEQPSKGNSKVKLLFVGRFVHQKGVEYLLQSVAQLGAETLAKVEVELIGNGPEEEKLRALTSQLGLGETVQFSGWVGREKIVDRYRAADIFVLPSFEEGMPNVVLEALGCGLPVVATDIYGNRELVRDGTNGFLVPTADVKALTQALSKLIDNGELREQMGRNSRTKVMSYSWASTADRYLALSEEILRQASPQPIRSDICEEG